MNANDNPGERHPLEPFLPSGARLLMLGSFPPQRHRWSMEFFYPNLQNDMWRIVGYLATGDKTHFLMPDAKRFDKERIEAFCRERGIALYDTAAEVIRLKDNASDNFLQVVREVDLAALLARIPACRTIVTTGQKATDTLRSIVGCEEPPVGGSVEFDSAGRRMRWWRMPSLRAPIPGPSNGKPNSIAGSSPIAALSENSTAGHRRQDAPCDAIFRHGVAVAPISGESGLRVQAFLMKYRFSQYPLAY